MAAMLLEPVAEAGIAAVECVEVVCVSERLEAMAQRIRRTS
jgi:hypothetical protein